MIRIAEPGRDAAGCLAIYAPFITGTATTFELEPPSAAEFARRMETALAHAPWLVCEAPDGRVAGYAYASRHRERAAYQWCVETSVYVGEGFRGRGLGRQLYDALLPALRGQGFCNAYAGITLPNEASVRFHESLGFVPVGVYRSIGYKLGQWHDVGWWSLALQGPRPPQPVPPVAFSEARHFLPIGTPTSPAT